MEMRIQIRSNSGDLKGPALVIAMKWPKTCVVMVGLPARGKSSMSLKLYRYFSWLGANIKIFNVGQYRRKLCKECTFTHHFFDDSNEEFKKKREEFAHLAMQDLVKWMNEDEGEIAIFDATNCPLARRTWILKECQKYAFHPLMIELICDNDDLISDIFINTKAKTSDYESKPLEEAKIDFFKRIAHYKQSYETVGTFEGEMSVPFIKILDFSTKFILNRINSSFNLQAATFLLNVRMNPKTIYLTRHGESSYNEAGILGGDPELTSLGKLYAKSLAQFIETQSSEMPYIVTSVSKRTIDTASYFDVSVDSRRDLNELNAGDFEGLTYDIIKVKHPDQFFSRQKNKLSYRYPNGESYLDVIDRLQSVILMIERQSSVLILSHQATTRCVIGFLLNIDRNKIPYIDISLHHLYKLESHSFGFTLECFKFDVKPDTTSMNFQKLESFQLSYI